MPQRVLWCEAASFNQSLKIITMKPFQLQRIEGCVLKFPLFRWEGIRELWWVLWGLTQTPSGAVHPPPSSCSLRKPSSQMPLLQRNPVAAILSARGAYPCSMARGWLRQDQVSDPCSHLVVVVAQSLSPVQLFATPRTAARQVSLPFTISQTLLRLMSIE